MKSRQRSEKRKQRFSEDSLLAVSKPQESTTNSTAPLQGSLRLEIVGRTPINPKTNKPKYYKDKPEAVKARDAKRMWVNGKEVKKSHPLYKAGRYKGFEEAAFSSLENYKESAEGEVYVITNKAWDGWVKVGMAVDAEDRLKNYQTSSPFRDYVLYYSYKTDDRRKAESTAHSKLEQLFERNNEWFKCTPQEAKGVLNEQQQDNG
jgi:hypothetical protein